MKTKMFAATESLSENLSKFIILAVDEGLILNQTKQKLETIFIHSENYYQK